MSKTPMAPNIETQRAAMKKLEFLAGEWSGQASVARGPGVVLELEQSEVAQFKLDGLVLMIEGVGRVKSDGKLALQALGLISFDDASASYRMRAYNDGRWLDTDVALLEDGKSLSWGFSLGEISTKSLLRINDEGDWTELAEITIGAKSPQKLLELAVRRVARRSNRSYVPRYGRLRSLLRAATSSGSRAIPACELSEITWSNPQWRQPGQAFGQIRGSHRRTDGYPSEETEPSISATRSRRIEKTRRRHYRLRPFPKTHHARVKHSTIDTPFVVFVH